MHNEDKNNNINILYTNIGRGHPFYLDGIIEALIKRQSIKLISNEIDVFEISQGISQIAWKSARWMYQKGSSTGLISWLYKRMRTGRKYSGESRLVKYLGRDILSHFEIISNPLLVAHPLLVGIIGGKKGLIYQHGELVTPDESLITGAEYVLVPTEEVAEKFITAGYRKDSVIITGLCIEPGIEKKAPDAYEARTNRFLNNSQLTGAYFSSGAEPSKHVHLLSLAAASAVKAGGRVIVFAKKGGKLEAKAQRVFDKTSTVYQTINSDDSIPFDFQQALIVTFQLRREENILSAHLFPQFDYFVAPAHERSNWAVGLGLPQFIVRPNTGPFAPLNNEFLRKTGVSEEIGLNIDANLFGTMLKRLQKSGKLFSMAQNGWNRYKIDGFYTIADFLINKIK